MKILTKVLAASLLLWAAEFSLAARLPLLEAKNWTSYHAVSKTNTHAFGVSHDGSVDLFFLSRGTKDNVRWPVQIRLQIQRKQKSRRGKKSRWVNKKVRRHNFLRPPKANEEVEDLSLKGEVTGGTTFQVFYRFSRSGVAITGKILNVADDFPYRIVVESSIGKLSTVNKKEAKDLKSIKKKTSGDEVRINARENKLFRVRFHEVLATKLEGNKELTAVVVKSKKIGRKRLSWRLVNEKKGRLSLECKALNGMPYAGFTVRSILSYYKDGASKTLCNGVILEYK